MAVDGRHQPLPDLRPVGAPPRVGRFTVGSVTGYPITPATLANANNSRRPSTIWYVYDSACCYEIVAEFRNVGKRGGGVTRAEDRARALAEQLNRESS